jgi:hypothetical protein
MITAAEFKKQIAKPLGNKLRGLGFKGSGFHYRMECAEFVFAIGIQASQWGGQCCAEYGIQPKGIPAINGQPLDLNKLTYSQCELRSRLSYKNKGDKWWPFSDDLQKNLAVANEIFALIEQQAVPVFKLFKEKPFVLDRIELKDMSNIYKLVAAKLGGMDLMTTDIRFAWAMAQVYEKRDPKRARQFAAFGMSKLGPKDLFMGRAFFERVLKTEM